MPINLNDMCKVLSEFFLMINRAFVVVPVLVAGYIWLSRKFFYHLVCLVFFSIIVNYALKVTFKAPLSLALNKQGFAFPSGHMQSATVFYSSLVYGFISGNIFNGESFIKKPATKKIFFGLLLLVLAGIGWAMTYHGFHDLKDVLAGAFCGTVLVVLHTKCIMTFPKIVPWLMVCLSSALLAYSHFAHNIGQHVWQVFFALSSLVVVENICNAQNIKLSNLQKILVSCICVAGVLVINYFYKFLSDSFPAFIKEAHLKNLQYAAFTLFLPLSVAALKRRG